MVILDDNGNEVRSAKELLDKFSNATVEQGVTDRILVKNEDGTVSWEERQVVRFSINQ